MMRKEIPELGAIATETAKAKKQRGKKTTKKKKTDYPRTAGQLHKVQHTGKATPEGRNGSSKDRVSPN